MDKFVIEGGHPLSGSVQVSGSKNASLPILAATLLSAEVSELFNVPDLADVRHMLQLFEKLGVGSTWTNDKLTLQTEKLSTFEAPYEIVRKMRATFWVLGPILARFGRARVSLPGGCAIGTRPIDMHLEGLRALGAKISLNEGYVDAHVPSGRLHGGHVVLQFPSVGATIHVMLAATLADGKTHIENAAREPEIAELAAVLNRMGAEVQGAGSSTITINGKKELSGFKHHVGPDRIETATWLAVAAATKSSITIQNVIMEQHEAQRAVLEKMGCRFEILPISEKLSDVKVLAPKKLVAVDYQTAPYPGFPTDAQAQMMACMTTASGASYVEESVFENRFMHAQELVRLGANITLHGNHAVVRGVEKLSGAPVMATDLRASASLVIAGLIAHGTTQISRIYHLDRGYVALDKKLQALGAQVKREKS